MEGLQGGRSPTGTSNQAWLCLDLLDALARLAELGHQTAVRSILEVPLKQCPEVLLLGLGSVRADWSHLHLEVRRPPPSRAAFWPHLAAWHAVAPVPPSHCLTCTPGWVHASNLPKGDHLESLVCKEACSYSGSCQQAAGAASGWLNWSLSADDPEHLDA